VPTENQWLLWLVFSAVATGVFLAVGAVAVRFRRQPIERLRLIQWTLLACLLAPLANQLPGLPRWSVSMATNLPQPTERAESAISSDAKSPVIVRRETPAVIAPPENIQSESRSSELTIGAQSIAGRSFDNTPIVHSHPENSASSPSVPSSPTVSVSSPSPSVGEGRGEGALRADKGRRPAGDSPSRSESAAISPWPRILLAIYALGVGAMFVWYAIGFFFLAWLNATARAAPEDVAQLFRAVTNDPAALRVRLAMHRHLELPLAFGLVRPTILLPESMCGRVASDAAKCTVSSPAHPLASSPVHSSTALRYSLIHEWSHLARGDVWRWRLSTLVGILFFYQPLFWILRRQLRLCQDYLADSHAATSSSPSPLAGEGRGEGDSASTAREDYAQFLVSLAHRRLGLPGTLALSIGDGRSNLYRRVQMLLENRQPLAQHLRWPRRFAIAATAIALIALASAIRLTADDAKLAAQPVAQTSATETKPEADASKQPASNAAPQPATEATGKADEKASPNAAKPEEFTFTGTVQEKDPSTTIEAHSPEEGGLALSRQQGQTGKPISGVPVQLRLFELDNSIPAKQTLWKEMTLKSNAEGKFMFTVPAEKFNAQRMGAQVEASQPGYTPYRQSLSLQVLQPPGAPALPFRPLIPPLEIDLLPAKSISGTVVSPDGKPVAGVGLAVFSRPSAWQSGNCYELGKTDERGRFELLMTATGDGELWVRPEKDFVPLRITIDHKRGDLGTIKLEPGITLKGHLLNAEGQPRAGVDMCAVNLERKPENAIDKGVFIQQFAKADAQGEFVFAPLPPGEYVVGLEPMPERNDLLTRYVPKTVTLAAGQEPAPVELRERFNPEVTVPITGHIEISKQMLEDIARMQALVKIFQRFGGFGGFGGFGNQPAVRPSTDVESPEKIPQLFAPAIHGTNNGVNASAKGEIDADGNFTIRAPRGMQQAVIELAGTRMLGLTQPGTSVRSQGNANDEESRYFQPQWRLDKDKLWATGTEIVVGDIGKGIGGIEVKYPETDKLHQFSVTGRVQDESTGQPIAGAKVVASLASFGGRNQLGEFVTDATGKFTVGIPIDALIKVQTAQPANRPSLLAIGLDVEHPDFASPRASGDRFQLTFSPVPRLELRGNFSGSGQLTPIYMRPGQEVTGTLQTPDGKPATGVMVLASTLTPIGDRLRNARLLSRVDVEGDKQYYGGEKQITDEAGRFKFVLPTEGDATLAIWPAKVYAPIIKEIHDQRGDLGIIKLERGEPIKGRVVDAENKTLTGIYVNAEPVGSEDKRNAARRRPIDYVNRAAVTDVNGNFELASLGPGEYRVELLTSATDLTTEGLQSLPSELHPLPDLFVPQRMTLVVGNQPVPLLFCPPPTVNVDGQVKLKRPTASASSTTNPYAQYKPRIVGEINGLPFAVATSIDSEGKFTAKVPKGATDVQVQLANREGPQVRAGKDKPLVDPGAISLGTVNEDVHGVEIVYP
jgi:beta-lactamase regulating signal transducer with metallopeptidase domain